MYKRDMAVKRNHQLHALLSDEEWRGLKLQAIETDASSVSDMLQKIGRGELQVVLDARHLAQNRNKRRNK